MLTRRTFHPGARRIAAWTCCAALVVPVAGWSQNARCNEPSETGAANSDAVAEAVFDEGRRLARENRWGNALVCFQRACELLPSPLCLRWRSTTWGATSRRRVRSRATTLRDGGLHTKTSSGCARGFSGVSGGCGSCPRDPFPRA